MKRLLAGWCSASTDRSAFAAGPFIGGGGQNFRQNSSRLRIRAAGHSLPSLAASVTCGLWANCPQTSSGQGFRDPGLEPRRTAQPSPGSAASPVGAAKGRVFPDPRSAARSCRLQQHWQTRAREGRPPTGAGTLVRGILRARRSAPRLLATAAGQRRFRYARVLARALRQQWGAGPPGPIGYTGQPGRPRVLPC